MPRESYIYTHTENLALPFEMRETKWISFENWKLFCKIPFFPTGVIKTIALQITLSNNNIE